MGEPPKKCQDMGFHITGELSKFDSKKSVTVIVGIKLAADANEGEILKKKAGLFNESAAEDDENPDTKEYLAHITRIFCRCRYRKCRW